MYSIFEKDKYTPSYPITTPGVYSYVERLTEEELRKVMSYYHAKESFVRNNHIIVRMIKWFNIPITTGFTDYLSMITDLKYSFYRHFEISSPVNRGEVRDVNTMIAVELYDDYFDLPPLHEVVMIKPLFTTSIDYTLPHPTRMEEKAVLGVDVVALMVKYREWVLYREENGLDSNPAKFVYMFVLTNMIPGYLSLSMINHLLFGLPKNEMMEKNTHQFTVRNIFPAMRKYIMLIQHDTKGKRRYYDEILLTLKIPRNNNALEYMRDDFLLLNNNNRWLYWIVKGIYLTQLMEYLGKGALSKNGTTIKEIRQSTRFIQGTNILKNIPLKHFKQLSGLVLSRMLFFIHKG